MVFIGKKYKRQKGRLSRKDEGIKYPLSESFDEKSPAELMDRRMYKAMNRGKVSGKYREAGIRWEVIRNRRIERRIMERGEGK